MKNTNTTLVRCAKAAALAAILASLTGCEMAEETIPRGSLNTGLTPNAPALTLVRDGIQGTQTILLRPGDPVEVRMGGIPHEDAVQITGNYIIDSDGFINLPHVGRVRAAGKTQSDLQQTIQAAYRAGGLYTNPTVTVNANSARFIYIGGAVRAPQRMAFTPDLTVLGAINSAGGFTDYANQSRVRLLRETHVYLLDVRKIRGNPSMDVYLKPGDKIDVPQSFW